jgi:outer membrane protein
MGGARGQIGMGKSYRAILRAGACALALAGTAGAARAESLADAIRLAYHTNPSLQQQRAQLRITDETYVQARAGYRPTSNLSASAQWQWQRLGTARCTVFAGVTSCGDQSPENNNLGATLSLNQPIYTGGRTTARVQSAVADILAGREDLRRAEGQLMLNVIQAYVDVRRDEQALAIRKENVAVLQRQVDETRARFDVGEVTRTDVAQSEAQLALAQSQLSTAQAQLAISRAAYASVVGQSPGTLEPEPGFKVFPDNVDQAFDTAQQNGPLIRAADYAEQGAGARVAEARAARLPTVGLQASYGYDQPLHPFDSGLNVRTFTAGVTVSQPIFSGGAVSSQIRQALEQENIARIQLEQARRTTVEDISQAWNRLLAARASISAGEEQVRAARIAFEGTRAEQQVGLRTTLEVLSAEQVLRDSELQLINARHDEYVASATVLNVMGLLEAKDLVADIDLVPGSHAVGQLRHTTGYIPGLEDAVQAIDSIGAPSIRKLPPPVDAPITTGQAAEAAAAGAR